MSTANTNPLMLVTGGAGYVGSTLLRDALVSGYRVRCLDLLIYGGRSIVGLMSNPNFELIRGDVRNKAMWKRRWMALTLSFISPGS